MPEAPSDFSADSAEKLLVTELRSTLGVDPDEPLEALVEVPDAAALELELELLDELPHAATSTATTIMGTMARNLPTIWHSSQWEDAPLDALEFLSVHAVHTGARRTVAQATGPVQPG